jgi:hypothetical protein
MTVIRRKDLLGKRFGRLLVTSFAENRYSRQAYWNCQCDCGNTTISSANSLIRGLATSCGCYQKEIVRLANKKYNQYDLSGEFGIGYTDKGYKFLFDLEDYEKIKNYCWYMHFENDYVSAYSREKDVLFHNLVMSVPKGFVVDHKFHNNFDNRKENLRIATNYQNAQNTKKVKPHSSKYKGVYFDKHENEWRADIYVMGKHICLGYFDNEEDAATAYNDAAIKYFGEFAYLNILD